MMTGPTLASALWDLLTAQAVRGLNTDGSAGHGFEDVTVESIYRACHAQGQLQVFPPRYTLDLPTVSGQRHQVDVCARAGAAYHLVECKLKHGVPIEHLYALAAKVMDYSIEARAYGHRSVFRAYMLVHPTQCNDHMYRFALAWGLTLVAPGNYPPVEHMLTRVPVGTPLAGRLERLAARCTGIAIDQLLEGPRRAEELFTEYRACIHDWDRGRYGR